MILCNQRDELLKAWHDAAVILGDCVNELQTCASDRFGERYQAAVLASDLANEARTTLTRHCRKHGCFLMPSGPDSI